MANENENNIIAAKQAMADKMGQLYQNDNGNAEQPAVEETPAVESVEEIPAETSPQEQPQPQQPPIDPLQLAQMALNATNKENEMLRQQLQQMQQLSTETQQANEETVMRTLTAPIFPQYEYDNGGDEERKAMLDNYNQEMAQYMGGIAAQQAEQQIAPMKQYYQQQTQQAEENNIINGIIRSGQFPDFQEKLPEIRRAIEQIPDLQKLAPHSKFTMAYLLMKGNDTIRVKPAQKTTEELLAEVENNPDLMKALEAKKIAAAKENSEIPSHVTSGGIANAAAAMPEQPPTDLSKVKDNIMRTRFNGGQYVGRQ